METQKSDKRKFYKILAGVALPIALQSLISSSLTLMDNLMVGQLGETALSSVGLATQIFFVQWMMIFGFCTGCSTFFTQFWGVRDMKSIRKVVGIALVVCGAASVIFFVLSLFFPSMVLRLFTDIPEAIELGSGYLRVAAVNFLIIAINQPFVTALRATQQTRLPLYITTVAFCTNTFLNYIFIFGKFGFPRMEIEGAALATVISRCLELGLILYVIFGRKNMIAAPIREFFTFNKSFAQRVLKNAWATTANETLWGAAFAGYNAAYGRLGITAYAAVQASGTIMDLFSMSAFSVGDASLILLGEQLGRGETEKAKDMAQSLIRVGVTIGIVFGVTIIICSGLILNLFDLTSLGAMYGRRILIAKGAFLPLMLYNAILVTGMLRSGGDTKFAMISEVSTMWLIGVPLAFAGALIFDLPVYMVVLLVQFENIVKGVILHKRYKSGKWIKNMIQDMN